MLSHWEVRKERIGNHRDINKDKRLVYRVLEREKLREVCIY